MKCSFTGDSVSSSMEAKPQKKSKQKPQKQTNKQKSHTIKNPQQKNHTKTQE